MNHTTRTSSLKRMLNDRRRDALHNSGDGVRSARACADTSLELVQPRTQTVARLDDALAQLDSGKYGSCLECAREISERRLSAAPFALRCQSCEDRRQADVNAHGVV